MVCVLPKKSRIISINNKSLILIVSGWREMYCFCKLSQHLLKISEIEQIFHSFYDRYQGVLISSWFIRLFLIPFACLRQEHRHAMQEYTKGEKKKNKYKQVKWNNTKNMKRTIKMKLKTTQGQSHTQSRHTLMFISVYLGTCKDICSGSK